jgi:hypothetical protein
MNQRVYEILIGAWMAVGILSIWRVINPLENSLNISGLWFFFSLAVSYALLWGRKIRRRQAGNVLSSDQRSPVLYLRSFKDDEITSRPIRDTGMPISFTEEEYLVDVLKDFGPCLAIGQPGETLPDLGAARIYVPDDTWQDKVRELLLSSKLVVLRAGQTPNFLWEVEQSIRNVSPQNIIILIPKMENLYNRFRKLAVGYFPQSLPEEIGTPDIFHGIASLHGYIYFEEDWTPHFTEFRFDIPFWQRRMAFPIQYVIRASLRPIYERSGIPVPKTENPNLVVIIIALSVFLVSLFRLGL